jgi:hypothetical protein
VPVPISVLLKIKARTFNKRTSDEEEEPSRGGLGDIDKMMADFATLLATSILRWYDIQSLTQNDRETWRF